MTSKCPLCGSSGEFSFQSLDLQLNTNETYQYDRCTNCNLIYQFPLPGPEQIKKFYTDDYNVYKTPNHAPPGKLRSAVLKSHYNYNHLDTPTSLRLIAPIISFFKYQDSIPYIPNAKALDVGCGNGKFMSRMNSIGWEMEGLDFSPLAIEICRKYGLKVTYGDLLSASFPNNSFDLVSARHVLEHVPNPEKFVIEIQRILKQGGLFAIRTPNSQALGRKWFGTNWYANDVPRHLFLFSFKNLDMLAQRNGLQLVYSKYFTTKKIFLKSKKIQTRNQILSFGQKIIWRFFSYLYILLAVLTRQGDEIFAIYKKI